MVAGSGISIVGFGMKLTSMIPRYDGQPDRQAVHRKVAIREVSVVRVQHERPYLLETDQA